MYTLKKSLGQHFLKDEQISKKIVGSLETLSFNQLLEVGPGGGAITKYLLEIPLVSFKAVELDEEKILYLEKEFPAIRGKIIAGSILEIAQPFEGPFTVIGNFPYNISSQILFRVLEWKDDVQAVVGMFQKEVAQRIAAPPGNKEYGILSVLMQAYFKVEYLFDVSETCFNPPPKVKSGVLRMVNLGDPWQIMEEKKFFTLVKTAFGQRRKQLRNPLKPLFAADVLQDEIFTKRAEELSVADYVSLLKRMK
jgi:16S rRNA (adenine1518-N6/adenine1519-N6)-dimethyltransferase